MSLVSQLIQTSHQQKSRSVLIIEDEQGQRIVNLDKNIYSLGRDSRNSIVIHSPSVSRHHATLLRINKIEYGGYIFQIVDGDLQGNYSTNGLIINGCRRQSHPLKHQDLIVFAGKAKAYYLVVDAELSEPEILESFQINRERGQRFDAADPFETLVPMEVSAEELNESSLLRLASIPELLPIPVIEIDLFGKITYLNSAALIQFPDLQKLQLNHVVLDGLLAAARSQERDFFVREVEVKGIVFEQSVHYISESRLIRSYLIDISDRQRASQEREQLLEREHAARIEAETAKQQVEFLAAASRVLADSLEYEATLECITGLVVPNLADFCVLDLVMGNENVQRVAWKHADINQQEYFDRIQYAQPQLFKPYPVASVLLRGKSSFVPEVTEGWMQAAAIASEHFQLMQQLQVSSLIAVPLMAREKRLGVLTLGLIASSNRRYTHVDLTLAEELAYRAALAIDNARAHQELQEVNRMKDEFLATLSHELRTPLNSMVGWTKLLRTRKFDEATTNRALETLDRNTQALAKLIEDVLDVSRIIRGKLRIAMAPVKLVEVIEAALETVKSAAVAKNIQIDTFLDESVGVVLGDVNRLQQIVWNLLTNAVKFTPNGGRVEVRLLKSENPRREGDCSRESVQIQVTDTGQGISPDFLPYVFERFRQGDSSTTRLQGGLGLGLAIVRHLVELHGGTVEALSPGLEQGSTFVVHLPLNVNAAPVIETEAVPPTVTEDVAIAAPPSLNGLRVLLVDDELDARELACEILRQNGAEVTPVSSAQAALDALQDAQFDVLVSDIGMPQEDGYSLIRKIRALPAAKGGQIPAVALTGYASASDRTQALLAGFHIHVAKPINEIELAIIVGQLTVDS